MAINRVELNSLHKYLYCSANPINRIDPSGNFGAVDIGISAGIGAGLGALEAGAYSYANGGTWGNIAASMAVGLVVGGSTGLALGFFAHAMTGALVSAGLSGGMAVGITGMFFGTAGAAMSSWGFYRAYQKGDTIGMYFAGAGLLLSLAAIGLSAKGIYSELTMGGNCFIAGTLVKTPSGDVAINQLQLGQRVETQVIEGGNNSPPPGDSMAATKVDPGTWHEIDLRMPDTAHPGEYFDIDLLRPESWIAENGAVAGGWIYLDLPEMKVHGLSEVTSIGTCPAVESGDGQVILGTFTHVARDVYDVRLVGLADPIGVTFNHPIWSLDRGGWTSAGDLHPGERVATETGNAVVQSVVVELGEHRVYNIEVETEHRYLVSTLGVLVHNVSPGSPFGKVMERAIQEKWAEKGDITAESMSLRNVEGPHQVANPESGLGPNQVRYQAALVNEVTGETVNVSVNFDPDTGLFGIIKPASGG